MRTMTFLAVLVLCGCTPYQSKGLRGGFSEIQLSPNTFQVHFQGNGYTSRERVADFVLLRAAELALKNNFRYFMIAGSERGADTAVVPMPQSSTTTVNTIGNTAYANTQSYGGMPLLLQFPSAAHTIVCFTENRDGMLIDAQMAAQSIRAKYRMKE
jgi:hypothetical protein